MWYCSPTSSFVASMIRSIAATTWKAVVTATENVLHTISSAAHALAHSYAQILLVLERRKRQVLHALLPVHAVGGQRCARFG
jgi:hypothetical protein